uniref:Uncharacterized protein n=1 Tax=Meloidogyne enterolobii TaxID=390850 RepID=A0A6V7W8V8_MELEN|nr:unnamed protein product [Meloidogyne enterolobii]
MFQSIPRKASNTPKEKETGHPTQPKIPDGPDLVELDGEQPGEEENEENNQNKKDEIVQGEENVLEGIYLEETTHSDDEGNKNDEMTTSKPEEVSSKIEQINEEKEEVNGKLDEKYNEKKVEGKKGIKKDERKMRVKMKSMVCRKMKQ